MPRAKRARTTTTEVPAKPAVSVTHQPTNGKNNSAELETVIRARAYELYEKRGREDGLAQQDWLQAEAEVLSQHGQRSA